MKDLAQSKLMIGVIIIFALLVFIGGVFTRNTNYAKNNDTSITVSM